MPLQNSSVGRIVSFHVDEATAREFNERTDGNPVLAGEVMPAMIVRVLPRDVCNLKVFRDAASDGWLTGVQYSELPGSLRTWSWPARV